jgi:hypothetical protein
MPQDVVIAKRVGVSRKKLFLGLFRHFLGRFSRDLSILGGTHFGLHFGVNLALF